MTERAYSVTPTPCPKCDAPLAAATSVRHPVGPKPGDLTVCRYCGVGLTFDDDLRVRAATEADLSECDAQTLAEFSKAWRAVARLLNEEAR